MALLSTMYMIFLSYLPIRKTLILSYMCILVLAMDEQMRSNFVIKID